MSGSLDSRSPRSLSRLSNWPATLDALAALSSAGRIDPEVAALIGEGYRALRTAEHRVQMIDDKQEHRLPGDDAALDAVARLGGLPDGAALIDG